MKKKWDILLYSEIRRKSFFSFKISVEIRAIFVTKYQPPYEYLDLKPLH